MSTQTQREDQQRIMVTWDSIMVTLGLNLHVPSAIYRPNFMLFGSLARRGPVAVAVAAWAQG